MKLLNDQETFVTESVEIKRELRLDVNGVQSESVPPLKRVLKKLFEGL